MVTGRRGSGDGGIGKAVFSLTHGRQWRSVTIWALVAALMLPLLGLSGDASAGQVGPAKRIILMIGDGMGDSEITAARNYSVGAAGRLAMDKLPMTGAYTTYSVQESNPNLPDYVAESASTATAWATGSKTANGRLSTTAGTDIDLKTILEHAQERGMATGNVSTAEITDATPASIGSHVKSRTCQGPTNMADCPNDKKTAGGPGSIAEQLVDHKIDVILGGGRARFEQTIEGGPGNGKTVVQSAQGKGYTYVTNASGLSETTKTPVLGLFTGGNMSLEWKGDLAKPGAGSGPQRCQEGQRPSNEPALAAMATKAVQLLDQRVANGASGFFLQIEGASIDKQDHAANPCGQIGENVAFDLAVKAMMDYAATRTDTLIIVTADHGHTSQLIPLEAKPLGLSSTLITNEGVNMRIHYGTAPEGGSQEHTGTQVKVAAMGPGAAGVVGLIDQTDVFKLMLAVMTEGGPAMPGLPNTGAGGGRNIDLGWLVMPAAFLALFGGGILVGRRRRV